MKQTLSLISKIHEKGNRFIIEQLKANGIDGLVPSHGDILAYLYCREKCTMKEIAEKIHRTKATVTVLVDKLEALDFVSREKSLNDNRVTFIVLTDKAKKFRKIFEKISYDLNEMLHKNLTDKDSELLDALLKKMI